MDTRRDFLKKSILLSGAAGFSGALPASIRRAAAIDPEAGSTFLDAEHVVILMQENRSFDHCFGSLQGVRGFNDPRVINLPDKNLAWLQTNAAGETYAPFRFDIRDTKITWMGSIPHSRSSQVEANNRGKYDQWLDAKRSGNKKYADMPLTLGHYTRDDLPFNYALADAFTVCDQNFASAMTSTWPNRLFFWSGTIRNEQTGDAKAFIRNDIPFGEANWKTFPQRLEDNNISWKVYQNDITCGGGFEGEERSWLANFGCNLLENFTQFNVRFAPRYIQSLQKLTTTLPSEIESLKTKINSKSLSGDALDKANRALAKKEEVLQQAKAQLEKWSQENFEKLSQKEKDLYNKAFTINDGDPDYHQLTELAYDENNKERQLKIPKGDILYQFRKDVDSGKLPTVSWLVGPENFSDHPTAPWYGAWYTSEILDILTKNPEVWKKTVFIMTYDENDGYFDHIPPFTAPDPKDPGTGKCSAGIDTAVEFIRRKQELAEGVSKRQATEGPIGLGYRVPMVIASPWSRGGKVCSQVFDHTSVLQFMETFLNEKYKKDIKDDNISLWRRTVTGNLTSAFSGDQKDKKEKLPFLSKDPFIEKIYNAKFKEEPTDFKPLTKSEIAQINNNPLASPLMPQQEKGIRTSCALPYQLYADGQLSADKKSFELSMKAGNEVFGKQSAGSPFKVYTPAKHLSNAGQFKAYEAARSWDYAVIAGDSLQDEWRLADFEDNNYHLRVYGPNGFYREYKGDAQDPKLAFKCDYQRGRLSHKKLTGNIALTINNADNQPRTIIISDNAYKNPAVTKVIPASGEANIILDLKKSFGWYDFTIAVKGQDKFSKRYAGRVDTGKASFTDPLMGRHV